MTSWTTVFFLTFYGCFVSSVKDVLSDHPSSYLNSANYGYSHQSPRELVQHPSGTKTKTKTFTKTISHTKTGSSGGSKQFSSSYSSGYGGGGSYSSGGGSYSSGGGSYSSGASGGGSYSSGASGGGSYSSGGSLYPSGGGGSYAGNSNTYLQSGTIQYNGGCPQQPRPPMNSMLRCSPDGCNATCMDGYRFSDGTSKIAIKCKNGVWSIEKPTWQNFGVAEAIPASCEAICSPPCLNNGICYEPNHCNCPDNFSGPRCESSRRPCLNYPPLPLNARRTCSTTSCTVTCLKGHEFSDGSAIASLKCSEGNWVPTRPDWQSVPDCEATCTPPCQNGGNCLSLNMCQCPQDYRGPQCQYRADSCSAKRLQFNGAYNCSGDSDSLSCNIKCPAGIEFEFAPAALYVCTYSTGVYKPQPIPQCVYGANMEVIPIGGGKETYYETISNSFESSSSLFGKNSGNTNHYSGGVQINNLLINDTNIGSANYVKQKSREDHSLTIQERLPSPGTCFTWGGAHYKTFDSKIFSATSDCAHTLVRDANDNIFSIVLKNSPGCLTNDQSLCHRLVKLYVQDKEYTLTKDETNTELPVLFSGKNKRLPIPGQVPGLRVKLQGHYVVVSLDALGLSVRWDGQKLVQVDVTQALWNRTEGLCGRFDGDPSNDMVDKDGIKKKNPISLLESWKVVSIGEECDSTPSDSNICSAISVTKTTAERARGFCAQLLADKKFSVCQNVMDVNVLMDACQWDYCACSKDGTAEPSECACQTMNMYVRECRQKGVKEAGLVKWRDEQICPMACTGGRIYKSCGPAGGLQATCGDTEVNEMDTEDLVECEEGCYCPTGTVLHDGKCIERSDCPCKLRGRSFAPGEQVPKECNTCTCLEGQWKCTEVQCGARCSAIGDPHYQTFDGKKFDFMGKCSYYLVKNDNYSVEAENVACPGSISHAMNFPISVALGMPSCTKSVTVRTPSGYVVKLKQNREVSVNGADITDLPHYLDGDVIRVASSMFIVLELENGMEIWWDGVTRVYVDVPASFRDSTRGLCGTFNANQKDDFLTPEGDVEQSVIPFANKWKVDERCEDLKENAHSKDHPCQVNVHNKARAEEYCSVLLSELFIKCHWLVDPQSFYENCLFDMCSCETKLSQCLCPIFSAYAKECSALGEIIDWRKEVHECGIQCTGGGQVFQTCGNSCSRSCADISSKPVCNKQCVEGCNCPDGQTLDEFGECIPVGQCPCRVDGLQFPAGYKEIRPATLAQELCVCTNALWPCRPATKEEIATYPKSSDRKAVCSATKNQEFTTCEPAVPTTCRNMHDRNLLDFSSAVCRPGCRCKPGFVLKDAHGGNGICIKPEECPCHHGGRSYIDKETVQNDCNNCTCTQGKWECTEKKCPATCSVWGDSHFRTFDGRTYDYQGQCDYVLTKGSLGKHDGFDVTVQSVPCGSLGVSCSRSVSICVAGETLTLTKDKPIPAHATLKRMSLRQTDLYVIVEVEDLGVTVQWDRGTRVYVRVDPRWKGRLKGLCGNYNDDQMDDFQTPSGGISEVSPKLFGDSWRLQPYCPPAAELVDTCSLRPERRSWAVKKCGILKSDMFAKCHSEVPVETYLEKCVFDACACDQGGDCECLCTALAAYAQECNMRGVAVHWRSKDLCPLQCDENCAKYSPCMSTCPQETCDNLLVSSKLGLLCSQETCVEGCAPKACPEGQVYMNASGVECVPRATCKPICMELDGVVYSEGDLIEEDECHSCYCTRTKKVCTGKPCEGTTTPAAPNDNTVKCQSGWTPWLNQDKPKNRKENKKGRKLDIEPLPSALLLNSLPAGDGRCDPGQMREIQCRTVEGHIDPKATGLDVECSLERGLVCKSDRVQGIRCPDFEIRVLCECDKPKISEDLAIAPRETCDVNAPNKKHETDCHAFYQCVPSLDGNVFVEKTCGPSMWYNPQTMICDWQESVLQVRSECADLESQISDKPKPIVKPPPNEYDDVDKNNATLCPPGFKYTECGTECHRLCLYYTFAIRQKGLCSTGSACEAGCIHESRQLSCPPGMLWRDNSTCVEIADCVCRSHEGHPVKPGTVFKESNCEFCQCIDNHYSCDRSACTIPSTKQFTHPPGQEFASSLMPEGLETEIPPEMCPEKRFINLLEPGAEWPVSDAAFTASSVLNDAHQPWHARSGAKLPVTSAGTWSPRDSNRDQYLQIDLGRVEPIYGISILGSPLYDEYVTSFQVLYSQDRNGKNWKYAKTKSGMPQLFRGCFDQRTPVKAMLEVPIEARYIRVNPRSWHNEISLRVDLIGCGNPQTTTPVVLTTPPLDTNWEWLTTSPPQEMCDDPMGVDNNEIVEPQISVSSDKKHLPKHGLPLNGMKAWQPLANTPNEWVKFDFLEPRNLTGVESKGGPDGWVSAYKVLYSHDDHNWNPVTDDIGSEKIFLGNFDQDTPYKNMFDRPLKARYLKIVPKKWTSNIQMRIEPHGCFETYPTVEYPMTTETPNISKSPCNHCPGVSPPSSEASPGESCKCSGTLWWDGSECVGRVQCPCQVGLISYPVGTVFEKEDCSQCLCALGGISQCEPKKCEPCEKDLRATVSATCGCVCKPCPADQRLCPTSNICINSTSWCNGIVECPDDEINCASATTIEPAVISTKAPIVSCPPVSCPPGFKIQLKQPNREEDLQKNLSPMFHMYGGRKTKVDRSSMMAKYFGAKGRTLNGRPSSYQGSKVLPRKTTTIKKQQQQLQKQICVEFVCEPPTGNLIKECPEPRCPPGYTVVYREDNKPPQLEILEPDCRSYECHPPPVNDDICNVTGRTFNTFDGTEYKYDICNHVLARDLHSDDWDVSLVKNCSGVCTRDLIVRHGSQLVKIFSDLSLEYNGYRYSVAQTGKIGAQNLAFVVSKLGDTLLFVSNHYGFWIMWNKQGNVKLGVTEKLIGQVDGLCGFYDKDPKNDKRQPNGKQARSTIYFGDSWALNDQTGCEIRTCPLHVQNRAYKMCQSVKDRILAPCHHAVGDIDGWISRCLETACACVEQKQLNKKGADETDDEVDQRCRCNLLEGFVVECTTAKPTVELEDWRMQMECPASCPSPLVHRDCYKRRCEPSCSNLAETDACPTLPNLCFPGCYCPAGLVRKGDKCVTPRECRDCECNVLPHLEYVTFDHSNHTANTNCTYIMARDRLQIPHDKNRDFEVYVSNAPCPRNPDKMCTSTLSLIVNEHRISITRGASQSDDHQVSIDDFELEMLPFDNGWVEITQLPARHINILVPKLQLEFRAYHPTLGASLKVPSHTYGGKMEGLCGDCDRDPDNDHKAPDGLPLRDEPLFVDSWRKVEEGKICEEEKVKECSEVKGPDGKDPCLVLLDADRFGQCHLLLDPAIFLSTCWHDTCGGKPELACSSLQTYALGCRAQGLCIDWHTELCPAVQCPSGTEYQLCGPSCAATCAKPEGCPKGKGIPSEGCFCPDGYVLKNGTECVEERECSVCDEEGHYPGDSWQPDACTSCVCENSTKTVRCEMRQCPAVDTVCDTGFEAIKVKKSESECCEKYACVPANTTKPECDEPKPLLCGEDQIRKLEKRPDGCHDYVCECKPLEECATLIDLRLLSTESPPPEGMQLVINDLGCCPKEQLICRPERCSKPPSCPKYHHLAEKQPIIGTDSCCPEYKCLPPPDKCLFTYKYTQADAGGERELTSLEASIVLLEENATIQDGPCRQCLCQKIESNLLHATCTRTECPSLSETPDFKDYILESELIRGQCCPAPKRIACKHTDGSIHQPGDKWALEASPCTILECKQTEEGVALTTHIVTCDTNCTLGSKYIEPKASSGECCGTCKQISCVIDGETKNVGAAWTSEDFCTEYKCVNDNGTILVSRKQMNCPEISQELLKEFEYRFSEVPGECCKKQEPIACLVDGIVHHVGETWADPSGDPCVSVTCLHSSAGGSDLTHQRTVTTCNQQCKPGWRYQNPSEGYCCGECIQISCIVNGTEYAPGQTWSTDYGCTTYECVKQSDGTLSTSAIQETCPDTTDCPEENLWQDQCCMKCNLTSQSRKQGCEPVSIPLEDTVGLVMKIRETHGKCLNLDPIEGFTECRGQCASSTVFNAKTSMHESNCTCCQAVRYTGIPVELICPDGYRFKRQIAVPSECDCLGCAEAAAQKEAPAKKSNYGIKG